MGNFLAGILSIVVSVVLVTTVVIPTFLNTNTTGWTAQDKAVFGLGTTISCLGLIYGIANVFGMM